MALTDDAMDKIKQMIQEGELRPGDRLPPEQELSARLGLSRSSMREAVKALEAMRILDVRRGDGTYVTSLQPSLLLEAMSFVHDFHESHAVLEVFEVRRILETASAALAARRATPDDVAAMRAHLSTIDATTSSDLLVEHDLVYHRMIANATGNSYLESILEGISSQTARARVWRALTQEGAVPRTLNEHEAVLDAIDAGDAEAAHAAMTMHIVGVERWLHAAAERDAQATNEA
ncbi:GntR family transcriptional regulator [Microcella alkaliphila]|uniref:GntR family transcriptional regulator n=1 Tax=Microcella alkaliphila TaxID=279828 RepID=A0A4Q7TJU7_9MICO|nr:FCD domain-containing protein [Microcella alkaliphila]RZT59522.1 GntR family transcriptional regulator [Microcella alkaliphila]